MSSSAPKIAFLLLCCLGALLGLAAYGVFLHDLKTPGPLAQEKTVYIQPGSSTRAIADLLHAEGAIDHPFTFLAAARLQKANGSIKAGEYLLTPTVSVQDIIGLLQSGKTYQRQITIPEGLMAVEVVDLLNSAEGLEGLIETIPAEGSLLPETYNYSRGDTRAQIIGRMQKSMQDNLASLWAGRDEGLPVKTPEEAVILASIVEKETGLTAERARVAGVFINRLKSGMPLQSDPTTIYALTKGEKKFERGLTRKDLELASPYNTYQVPGLPPGPIANPGAASIHAVMHPESHGYFYFVADGTGGHAFAENMEGHLKNVANWREISKKSGQ
jgi:UPF0755 protein